jgi:flagellar protein FlaG
MTIYPHQTTTPVGELGTRRANPLVAEEPRRIRAAAPPSDAVPGTEEARPDAEVEQAVAEQRRAEIPEFPLQQLAIRKDPEIDRVVVQVLDAATGEVVRQIPSEEWVSHLKRLRGAKGLFVDQKG